MPVAFPPSTAQRVLYGLACATGGVLCYEGVKRLDLNPASQDGGGDESQTTSLSPAALKATATARAPLASAVKANAVRPRAWDYNYDQRQPDTLVKPLRSNATEQQASERAAKVAAATPHTNRRVILIRHGQYDNVALADTDDTQCRLTPLGREQAALTGRRLRELLAGLAQENLNADGQPVAFKLSFAVSTMTRAKETAEIILKELEAGDDARLRPVKVQYDDLIREGAPIEPVPAVTGNSWNPDPSTFFVEGSRIESAFRKYIHRASPVPVAAAAAADDKGAAAVETKAEPEPEEIDVLVCHGNVIRYFLCRSLQLPPDAWLRFGVHNGSITVLNMRPSGRVSVRTVGEAGHLPQDKLTFN